MKLVDIIYKVIIEQVRDEEDPRNVGVTPDNRREPEEREPEEREPEEREPEEDGGCEE